MGAQQTWRGVARQPVEGHAAPLREGARDRERPGWNALCLRRAVALRNHSRHHWVVCFDRDRYRLAAMAGELCCQGNGSNFRAQHISAGQRQALTRLCNDAPVAHQNSGTGAPPAAAGSIDADN